MGMLSSTGSPRFSPHAAGFRPSQPGSSPASVVSQWGTETTREPVLRLVPKRAWLPRAPEPPVCGCGWFQSSHELAAGLAITEWDDGSAPPADRCIDYWGDGTLVFL